MREGIYGRRLNGLSQKKKNTSREKQKRKLLKTFGSTGKDYDREPKDKSVSYICRQCRAVEEIPLEVVEQFDWLDGGDPHDPPRFSCQVCQGEMIPEYFRGATGVLYDNRYLRVESLH